MNLLEAFGRLPWWEKIVFNLAVRLLPMIGFLDRFEEPTPAPSTARPVADDRQMGVAA